MAPALPAEEPRGPHGLRAHPNAKSGLKTHCDTVSLPSSLRTLCPRLTEPHASSQASVSFGFPLVWDPGPPFP